MTPPSPANAHDQTGDIGRTHGSMLVRTLRTIYGCGFARGFEDDTKLSDVLHALDKEALSRLLRDYDAGRLDRALHRNHAIGPHRAPPPL